MARIKAGSENQSGKVKSIDPINYGLKPVLFSLEKVQSGKFGFDQLDRDDKGFFSEAMFKRKDLTWNEIQQNGRHSLGMEKINRSSIRTGIPNFITEDVSSFQAFRFKAKAPMVGYREKDVFFVLWFDPTFELYKH